MNFLAKQTKKIDEKWGVGHIVLHEFLSKTNKRHEKHKGVVKLCWNDFLSKANDINVIYSGDGSIFFGMNLLVNLTKKVREKTYGSCQIMLE